MWLLVQSVSVRCPFYGFRWPENSSDLFEVGGNECAFELESHGPCEMERQGRTVNFDYCEVPVRWKPMLEAFRDRVQFHVAGRAEPLTFACWRDTVMRRKAS